MVTTWQGHLREKTNDKDARQQNSNATIIANYKSRTYSAIARDALSKTFSSRTSQNG